jgi:hypothetical protein
LISEHFDAFKALVTARAALADKAFDSARLTETGGLVRGTYVIIFGGGPDRLDDERLTSPQLPDSEADFIYPVRSVSTTPAGARATADHVMQAVLGKTPAVAGRSCSRVRMEPSGGVETDDNAVPPLFYCDDEYSFTSSRQ